MFWIRRATLKAASSFEHVAEEKGPSEPEALADLTEKSASASGSNLRAVVLFLLLALEVSRLLRRGECVQLVAGF